MPSGARPYHGFRRRSNPGVLHAPPVPRLLSAPLCPGAAQEAEPPPTFEAFRLTDLREARAKAKTSYHSFLERPPCPPGCITCGGFPGRPKPHDRDEVYHVLAGKGRFTAGETTVDVAPGEVLFVAAGVEHRFHDIAEDLELLVFFSKAKPPQPQAGQTR